MENVVKKLGGVYPALLTPFTKEGGINRKALEELVEYNIQKGVTGFYVGGSTAEAFLLTEEERNEALLRFWVLKEAEAKCSGLGLRGYPNHTEFDLNDPRVQKLAGCMVAVIQAEKPQVEDYTHHQEEADAL